MMPPVIRHRVLLPTCSNLPGHGNLPSSRLPAKVSGRTEAGSHIRIKIRRDAQQLTIEWPAHAARECGAWLSALLS